MSVDTFDQLLQRHCLRHSSALEYLRAGPVIRDLRARRELAISLEEVTEVAPVPGLESDVVRVVRPRRPDFTLGSRGIGFAPGAMLRRAGHLAHGFGTLLDVEEALASLQEVPSFAEGGYEAANLATPHVELAKALIRGASRLGLVDKGESQRLMMVLMAHVIRTSPIHPRSE